MRYMCKTNPILFIVVIFTFISVIACTNNNSSTKPDAEENMTVSFIESDQSLGNTRSFGMALADIDMDDDLDIFITNYIGPSKLWLNNGEGIYSESGQSFNLPQAHDVDIADLNGDSFPDLFIVGHSFENKIYFNDGSGSFTDSGQQIGSATEESQTVQLCDVDGDNDADALIYSSNSQNRIWLNNGKGYFSITDFDYGVSDSKGLMLADLNNDNSPDLVINERTRQNQIWINDGLGNFTKSGQELGGATEDIGCMDIDGDGDIDVLEAGGNEIRTWLNQNNSGTFIAGNTIEEGALVCCLFDADLDGDTDLITAHITNGNKLWLNDGSGSFTSIGAMFGNDRVLSIAFGKIDPNNDIDVLLGKLEGTGGNKIYINNRE